MLTTYVTAAAGMVVIMLVWVGVQRIWHREFTDRRADPDALAGRLGCHGCDCTDSCQRDSVAGVPLSRGASHE
jgi:hypothetical protein